MGGEERLGRKEGRREGERGKKQIWGFEVGEEIDLGVRRRE